jgi:hypothetical protein
MAATRKPRATPRGAPEERAAALRAGVLDALKAVSRTTKQVVAIVEEDPQAVYRALISLEKSGKVASVREHHVTVHGIPGRIWSRCDALPPVPIPPRDPLLWAMFGGAP